MFPEYNRRAGRLISLDDRIVDCFLRSQNATGTSQRDEDGDAPQAGRGRAADADVERSAGVLRLSDLAVARLRDRREPVVARAEHDRRQPR